MMADKGLNGLAALANAAQQHNDETDEDITAGTKRRSTQYAPIDDKATLAELRAQGLTEKGEKKLSKGDLRCRPALQYRSMFVPTLPQFRLASVDDTARAEDLVVLWSHLTGREATLRTEAFHFDHTTYLGDAALLAVLKGIENTHAEMETFIKQRYGTQRHPKRSRGGSADASKSHIPPNAGTPSLVPSPHAESSFPPAMAEPLPRAPTLTAAHSYLQTFRDAAQGGAPRRSFAWASPQQQQQRSSSAAEPESRLLLRALHKAAWEGQAQAAAELATQCGGCNAPLSLGVTPLHQAVFGSRFFPGAVHTVRALLEKGANVGARDEFGRSPLYHAARRGAVPILQLLLEKGGEIAAAALDGSTPLHAAASSGSAEAVKLLLYAGAPARPVRFERPMCGTALHWAAKAGQSAIVRELLAAGFDASARDWNDATPLHLAAYEACDDFFASSSSAAAAAPNGMQQGVLRRAQLNAARFKEYVNVIRMLLGHGADVNAMDAAGRTPLALAASRGNSKCAQRLVAVHQASIDAPDAAGWIPLVHALLGAAPGRMFMPNAADGGRPVWKVLCADKIAGTPSITAEVHPTAVFSSIRAECLPQSVLGWRDTRGRSLLHLAAVAGNIEAVGHLVGSGAVVDARDTDGATPLLLAVRARRFNCVKKLLGVRADADAMDAMGSRSLAVAAILGDLETLNELLSNGASVNARHSNQLDAGDASNGRTALHEAAAAGRADVMARLVAAGVKVDAASAAGRTALHEAAEARCPAAVDLLLRAGANQLAVDARGNLAVDHADAAAAQHGIGTKPVEVMQAKMQRLVPLPAWIERLELLKEFQAKHGRLPAVGDWHRGFALGLWVDLQRERLRWDEFNQAELLGLNSALGSLLDWGVATPWADWLRRVRACVAERRRLPAAWERHGGHDVGLWLKLQQCKGMIGGLTELQRRQLETLRGWEWDTQDTVLRRCYCHELRLRLFLQTHTGAATPGRSYLRLHVLGLYEFLRREAACRDLPESRWQWLDGLRDPTTETVTPGGEAEAPESDEAGGLQGQGNEQQRRELGQALGLTEAALRDDAWCKVAPVVATQPAAPAAAAPAPQAEAQLPIAVPPNMLRSLPRPYPNPAVSLPPPNRGGAAAAAAAASGAPPVTPKTAGLPANLIPAVEKAQGSRLLKGAEVMTLLTGWKAAGLPVASQPPNRPEAGTLFFLAKDSRYKQDGHTWVRESHSTLSVDGEKRVKCYYASLVGGALQRRCYWDKRDERLVLVQYLARSQSKAARGPSARAGSKRAAAESDDAEVSDDGFEDGDISLSAMEYEEGNERLLSLPYTRNRQFSMPMAALGPDAMLSSWPPSNTSFKLKLKLPRQQDAAEGAASKPPSPNNNSFQPPRQGPIPPLLQQELLSFASQPWGQDGSDPALPLTSQPLRVFNGSLRLYCSRDGDFVAGLGLKDTAGQSANVRVYHRHNNAPEQAVDAILRRGKASDGRLHNYWNLRWGSKGRDVLQLGDAARVQLHRLKPEADGTPAMRLDVAPGHEGGEAGSPPHESFSSFSSESDRTDSEGQVGSGQLVQIAPIVEASFPFPMHAAPHRAPPAPGYALQAASFPYSQRPKKKNSGDGGGQKANASDAAGRAAAGDGGGVRAQARQEWERVPSMPPMEPSPLENGPTLSTQPLPAPAGPSTTAGGQQPIESPTHMQQASAPCAERISSDVLAMLRSASLQDRLSISRALKAVYDSGVGGSAMRWAAIQAAGKRMSLADIAFAFESVRDYVLLGQLEEAAQWVKDLKDANE